MKTTCGPKAVLYLLADNVPQGVAWNVEGVIPGSLFLGLAAQPSNRHIAFTKR